MLTDDPNALATSYEKLFFQRIGNEGLTTNETAIEIEVRFGISADTMDEEINGGLIGLCGSFAAELPNVIRNSIRKSGRAILNARTGARSVLDHTAANRLLPLLPWPDRRYVINRRIEYAALSAENMFVLPAPLVGQGDVTIRIPLGEIYVSKSIQILSDSLRALPMMTFELTSIIFEEGSIKAKLKVILRNLTLGSTMLSLPYITPIFTKAVNHQTAVFQAESTVNRHLQGQPAESFCSAQLSFDSLESARERGVNYHEAHISDFEKMCRVAQAQALLGIGLNIDLKIDGKIGPETRHAEIAFAHLHNIPCTNCPEFRGRLAQVIDDLVAKKEGQSKET